MGGAPLRRYVVGVDGSEAARGAYAWARWLAQANGGVLDAVYAWQPPGVALPGSLVTMPMDPEPHRMDAEAFVDDIVGEDASGGEVRAVARMGHAAAVLLEASEEAEALVVGSRGRGGFASLLLGSVSHQCVQHGRCPVIVVPAGATPNAGPVVVGVDGSAPSEAALRWAVDVADVLGGPVRAVMAWSWLDQSGSGHQGLSPDWNEHAVRRALDESVARALGDRADRVGERVVVCDLDARALLEASEDASLLVVGARGLGGFKGLLLGSVSRHCVEHASCPVGVVRHYPVGPDAPEAGAVPEVGAVPGPG